MTTSRPVDPFSSLNSYSLYQPITVRQYAERAAAKLRTQIENYDLNLWQQVVLLKSSMAIGGGVITWSCPSNALFMVHSLRISDVLVHLLCLIDI
jgi:hypothetical protein